MINKKMVPACCAFKRSKLGFKKAENKEERVWKLLIRKIQQGQVFLTIL
jgi:hypothetical protein